MLNFRRKAPARARLCVAGIEVDLILLNSSGRVPRLSDIAIPKDLV